MAEEQTIKSLHQYILDGAMVCTDSRKHTPNGLYFALKGDHFDGNEFAEAALNNGCQLAVVDNPDVASDSRFVVVDDALKTLQKLGTLHRDLYQIPLIGITGSNGKTTTKELIYAILSRSLKTIATKGNLNNHIGVPLTLLSFPDELDVAIVEMGANHKLEIGQLCEIAKPGYGLITNIGKAHLEGFGSFDDVVTAKKELYDYIGTHDGLLFVHAGNALLEKLSKNHKRILYGDNPSCHCAGAIISSHPFLSVSFVVNKAFGKASPGIQGSIQSKLCGNYNFENILAAVTIGLYFGIKAPDIIHAIENYQPANNRSQLIETTSNKVIMDAYNANPSSMAASIESFSPYKNEGKTAVFIGDMLELGVYAQQEHEKIYQLVKNIRFDLAVFIGDVFSGMVKPEENIFVFPNAEAASDWMRNNPIMGYRVLIKGSRGIKMEQILKYL